MSDLLQILSTVAVVLAAVLAMVSVVLTYRVSARVRGLEVTLKTKTGEVSSSTNEEDAQPPAAGSGSPGGDADE